MTLIKAVGFAAAVPIARRWALASTMAFIGTTALLPAAHAQTTHWDQSTQSYQPSSRLSHGQLVEEGCQLAGRLVRAYANDRDAGISLDAELNRYSQQPKAADMIRWTYRASEMLSPQQAQDTVYSLCLKQERAI